MADTQILRAGGPAPFDYLIPANAELVPKVVSAVVDGTGAAGSFEPTLIIESDAGEIVAEIAAPSMSAGASGRTSWFPEGDVATSGGGIQYDTDNEGGWLFVGTDSSGGPLGSSIVFSEDGFGDIILQAGTSGMPASPSSMFELDQSGMTLRTFSPANDDMTLQFGPNGINWQGTSSSVWTIENDGTGGLTLVSGQNMDLQALGTLRINPVAPGKLAFFGAAGSAQVATPVTLADVIALLQAYGLCP